MSFVALLVLLHKPRECTSKNTVTLFSGCFADADSHVDADLIEAVHHLLRHFLLLSTKQPFTSILLSLHYLRSTYLYNPIQRQLAHGRGCVPSSIHQRRRQWLSSHKLPCRIELHVQILRVQYMQSSYWIAACQPRSTTVGNLLPVKKLRVQ